MNQFYIEMPEGTKKVTFEVTLHDTFEEFMKEGMQKSWVPYGMSDDRVLHTLTKEAWIGECKRRGIGGTVIDKEHIHLYFNPEKLDIVGWAGVVGHEVGHVLRPHHRNQDTEEKKAFVRADLVEVSVLILQEILDCMGYEIKEK